jgi:hypothetical protein
MSEEEGQALTLDEQVIVESALRKMEMEEKPSKHSFLVSVQTNASTTRTGNLKEDELGAPRLPFRTLKECELICRKLVGDELWAEFFMLDAENLTSSSLSKEGFLVNMASMERREFSDKTSRRKSSSSWFKKGNKEVAPA